MKNIYVGNLDFATTEAQVRDLFEPHGSVQTVTLVRDRETGNSRGFAFVEMPSDGEAETAMNALNGMLCGDRSLKISEALPKGDRAARSPQRRS